MGSVTATNSILERTTRRNRKEIEKPRSIPKSVMGKYGPNPFSDGMKNPRIVPFTVIKT